MVKEATRQKGHAMLGAISRSRSTHVYTHARACRISLPLTTSGGNSFGSFSRMISSGFRGRTAEFTRQTLCRINDTTHSLRARVHACNYTGERDREKRGHCNFILYTLRAYNKVSPRRILGIPLLPFQVMPAINTALCYM